LTYSPRLRAAHPTIGDMRLDAVESGRASAQPLAEEIDGVPEGLGLQLSIGFGLGAVEVSTFGPVIRRQGRERVAVTAGDAVLVAECRKRIADRMVDPLAAQVDG